MENVVNFLLHHYREVILVISVLINLIIFVINRGKTTIYDASAYSTLLTLINEAEEKFGPGRGADKLEYVVRQYIDLKNLDNNFWTRSSLVLIIERLLNSPTKKGGPGREETK